MEMKLKFLIDHGGSVLVQGQTLNSPALWNLVRFNSNGSLTRYQGLPKHLFKVNPKGQLLDTTSEYVIETEPLEEEEEE